METKRVFNIYYFSRGQWRFLVQTDTPSVWLEGKTVYPMKMEEVFDASYSVQCA